MARDSRALRGILEEATLDSQCSPGETELAYASPVPCQHRDNL